MTMTMLHNSGVDEARDAQEAFRLLLDAITWPGKVNVLPPAATETPASWPVALVQVASMLLKGQRTFAVLGENLEGLSRYLAVNTGCRPAPVHHADYVIAGHPLDWLDVWAVSASTAPASRKGAMMLLAGRFVAALDVTEQPLAAGCKPACVALENSKSSAVTQLDGRGIQRQRGIMIDDDVARLLRQLAAREAERPAGIDVILADGAGRIAALPNKTWRQRGEMIWAK